MSVIIDVDIGNSFVKWRMVGDTTVKRQPTASLIEGWQCELSEFGRVRVASVASRAVTQSFCQQVQERWCIVPEVAKVCSGIAGVIPCYTDISRLGVDRWLAMLAAYHLAGGACVAVTAGSALTADWVVADGLHVGGLIAPGRQKMLDVLHQGVANVLIDAMVAPAMPALGLGRNTTDCVLQGVNTLLAGFMAQVLERDLTAPLFLAGGDANVLLNLCVPEHKTRILLIPNLVLDGLAIAMP